MNACSKPNCFPWLTHQMLTKYNTSCSKISYVVSFICSLVSAVTERYLPIHSILNLYGYDWQKSTKNQVPIFVTEITMNYEFEIKMNNKLENLSCYLIFILIILYQKYFYQKLWRIWEWSTYWLCPSVEKTIWGPQINC